jgi:hypothetical protein
MQRDIEVKDQFPGTPWQQPIRLRNRIVHCYWSIDLEVLHTAAAEQLPAFAADLRHVLATSPKAPERWQRSSHRRRYKARQRQLADWFVKTPLRQGQEANRIVLPRRLPK